MTWRLALAGAALAAALTYPAGVFAAGGDEGFDPLEFTGPHFLWFYAAGQVMVVFAAVMIRQSFRQPDEGSEAWTDDAGPLHLEPYETAYLAGGRSGADRATIAALASLAQCHAIEADAAGHKYTRGDGLTEKLHPVEMAVYDATSAGRSPGFPALKKSAGKALDAVRDRLTSAGLLVSPSVSWKAQVLGSIPVLLWVVLGFMKLSVGLSRHKPVGFLVLLLLVTGLTGIVLFFLPLARTRLGDRVLNRLKADHAALKVEAKARSGELKPEHLVTAMGLFGPAILAGGPLASVYTAMSTPGSGGGGCGGSGCGGGGCGGGCGGCGGG